MLQRERSQPKSWGEHRTRSGKICKISVTGQRGFCPDLRFFSPSIFCKVNYFIHLPTDERTAQSSLEWFLSHVCWASLRISLRSLSGIAAMIGIAQSGWWFDLAIDQIAHSDWVPVKWSTIWQSHLAIRVSGQTVNVLNNTKIVLHSTVRRSSIDEITLSQKAKVGCPVSKVLKADITLDYQLN